MQETFKGKKTFYAKSRKEWRKWLEKNSETEKSVWLIFYNKLSKIKSVPYEEAVEEGLCFGWIDSVKYKRDDESSYQYFSPRKPKSNWSKSNRDRVKKLTEAGLMTESGQKLIDHAKKSGTWHALVQVENSVIPEDLQKLFNKNKTAQKHFNAFSNSAKRIILEWILSAKRPETRAKRIEETVHLASKNIKSR
ncbi:MAG: YdeI/OmpD-associated family protein [Bacteroidetes bacterium]|nr:YdeI/OmpD-associated family protein [Bacteroidota bacterium]